MPRILHAIESLDPGFGGTVESALQLARVLRSGGLENEIVTLDGPEQRWPQDMVAEETIHRVGPPVTFYRYCRRLPEWLERNLRRYDAVIVHGLWRHHNAGVWMAARRGGVPRYVIAHSMLNSWFNETDRFKQMRKTLYWWAVEHKTLRDARAVVFSSEQERAEASESFRPYRCRETVIPLGTGDPAREKEVDASIFLRRFPHLRNTRRLLFLGRLHPMKACDLLIDAFAAIAKTSPEVHLVMAGPDAVGWQAELERRVGKHDLNDRVTFSGALGGEEKWSALAGAELFVLPSHCESTSYATIEALGCGVPVLVSDKVNSHEVLRGRRCAIITRDTVESIVGGLEAWLRTGATERREMSADARACFVEHFDIGRTAAGFLAMFRADLGWQV